MTLFSQRLQTNLRIILDTTAGTAGLLVFRTKKEMYHYERYDEGAGMARCQQNQLG